MAFKTKATRREPLGFESAEEPEGLRQLALTLKLIGPVLGRPEQSEAPVPACGGIPHVIVYLSKSWISEMAVAATALRKPIGDRSSLRPTSTISPNASAIAYAAIRLEKNIENALA